MFENLHKTKKLAFLDGLLCGLIAYHTGGMFRKMILADQQRRRNIALFPGSQKN